MAKRKKAQPWDAVFDRIRVSRNPAWVCVPLATETDLYAIESQLESRLPQSYREFMKRFGPGELMSWIQLDQFSPSITGFLDVVGHTSDCRKYVEEAGNRFPNAGWFQQLVYFASSGGGDWYCWDPSAQVPPGYECPYLCLRHGHEHNPVAAGNTFWEFVTWADADVRSWRYSEPDESPPNGIEFCPSYLRDKEKPRALDVHLWLACNNHTARDLALSIRDHGRTDAFPILADALQEAGCTNADLLDSCRTGDPDIDGAWVLRVLLRDA
ncbi:SMI1/KNR4 family protein [Frigoriglobus tundricola]|uniref:SMI1/KNR4 family protein n=1 Tax=Frigoriglobus tundricola TaxID=2774151 RepID=UPI00148EA9FB|nr:SMI1/KNR4 family protein [Frigoriglobus tundricola]